VDIQTLRPLESVNARTGALWLVFAEVIVPLQTPAVDADAGAAGLTGVPLAPEEGMSAALPPLPPLQAVRARGTAMIAATIQRSLGER
jgi:hypothetical protein